MTTPPRASVPPRNLSPLSPEMEDLNISVRSFHEMRERSILAETERDHWQQQAHIWKARAEAEAALLLEIKLERDKLSDFKTKIVLRFKDLHSITSEIMKEATDYALRPRNETTSASPEVRVGPGDNGQPVPTFLTDRDLETPPQ